MARGPSPKVNVGSVGSPKGGVGSIGSRFDAGSAGSIYTSRGGDMATSLRGMGADGVSSIKNMDVGDQVAFFKSRNITGGDLGDILKKMKLQDDKVADLLKKMNLTDAELNNVFKKLDNVQADDVAKKMGKKWDSASQTLVTLAVTGAAVGTTLAILQKEKDDADEATNECIDACLPTGWDEYENSSSKDKTSLKFSDVESTRKQPICKEAITNCGEYCNTKCKAEYGYKPPIQKVFNLTGNPIDPLSDLASGPLSLFENFFQGIGKLFSGPSLWISGIMSLVFIFIIIAPMLLKRK